MEPGSAASLRGFGTDRPVPRPRKALRGASCTSSNQSGPLRLRRKRDFLPLYRVVRRGLDPVMRSSAEPDLCRVRDYAEVIQGPRLKCP